MLFHLRPAEVGGEEEWTSSNISLRIEEDVLDGSIRILVYHVQDVMVLRNCDRLGSARKP